MVRVATFNAGLAIGYLPNVNERLPHVIEALTALEVDILFVQELWLDDHWARLAERWPYSFRPAPLELASGGCTADQLAPLIACAKKHCAGLRDEALAGCVVRHCAAYGLAISPACVNCITSNISGTIEDITGRCLTVEARAGHDAPIAYGGSFGTGLLSRVPLEATETITYSSTINARGAVYARAGDLHVFGTHFSPGGMGGAEQAPQFAAFAEWSRTKPGPAVLLGDLNTSDGSKLFKVLLAAGFREPDEIDIRPTCYSSRIDHVLVRDMSAHVVSKRILDSRIRLANGERSALSDHYGVMADVAM